MEQRDLRVSDAERQQVAEVLQGAVGEGYITLSEFEERADRAFSAKTRSELDEVIADIPGSQPEPAQRPDVPVPTSSQPTEIRATGTNLYRKGAWEVPAALAVHSRASNVVLDFTEAVLKTSVVDVALDDKASSIKVVLPEAATVDCNELQVSWGDLDNNVPTGPPRGNPHVVLRGKVRVGSVKIRRTRKGSWWNRLGLD